MLSCLIARRLGARHTIARVRNPIYYQQIDILKEDLRLSMAVNPELAVANEISRVLIFPVASKIETFVKGRVELVEFTVWRRFIGNIRLRYLSAQYKEERKFIFRTESLFHRKAISFTLQHPIGRLSSSLNLWEIVRIRSEEF